LGIEEQYYIVWPAILVLACKTRLNKLAIISLSGAASFAFMLAVPTIDAFYLLPARFWELLVGGALAYCETDTGSMLQLTLNRISAALGNAGLAWPALSNIAGGLAVILLAFALISLNPTTPYPRYNALLPTLAALLLIAAGPSAWLNRRILANRTAVALGLISYPLYLCPHCRRRHAADRGPPGSGVGCDYPGMADVDARRNSGTEKTVRRDRREPSAENRRQRGRRRPCLDVRR
jgi:peptidoglycan/LPS O-acetylase OafA/YrhL